MLSKEFIKEFINNVPLEIHYLNKRISVVGIQWGFCQNANETYGRKTVMKILDLLENNKEYQELLDY